MEGIEPIHYSFFQGGNECQAACSSTLSLTIWNTCSLKGWRDEMMSNSEVVPIRNTPFNNSRKKEWKKLTRFQKNWILEKAYRLYVSFLTDKHWFPHCSERRYLIEVLYAQICDRGIMIPKCENGTESIWKGNWEKSRLCYKTIMLRLNKSV